MKADADCRAAAFGLTATPPFTADAVFHAEQAAAKALKGFLAWHDVPFRYFDEIGHQCTKIDDTLGPLLFRAAPLSEYAWRHRYPGSPEDPSREKAQEALALACEVCEAVFRRLPQETRP